MKPLPWLALAVRVVQPIAVSAAPLTGRSLVFEQSGHMRVPKSRPPIGRLSPSPSSQSMHGDGQPTASGDESLLGEAGIRSSAASHEWWQNAYGESRTCLSESSPVGISG